MKFSLKSYSGRLIWEGEAESTKAALIAAFLRGAVLRDADLRGAVLRDAVLRDADLPKIPNIDSAILAAVKGEGCALKMADWHSCGTTHCRGGWAIHLAGEAGETLERAIGPNAAGRFDLRELAPKRQGPQLLCQR